MEIGDSAAAPADGRGWMLRRFLLPAPLVSVVAWVKWRAQVSPRAEVELSPNLALGRGTTVSSFAKIKSSQGRLVTEEGHLAREPEYVGSAGAFATGTPDGVRSWLRHCATAVETAARGLVK